MPYSQPILIEKSIAQITEIFKVSEYFVFS